MSTKTITTCLLLAAFASITACSNNDASTSTATSTPPEPPSELSLVSVTTPSQSDPATTGTMMAVLHDGAGHTWNYLVVRKDTTDQIQAEVRLQSEDRSTSYSLLLAPSQIVSHLSAGKGHWDETLTAAAANAPSTLSGWSQAVTVVGVKVGDYLQAQQQPIAAQEETTYGWCDTACSAGCNIMASAGGALAAFLACEVAIGWTGVGATMCTFIVATGFGTAASIYCTNDCINTYCTCAPTCNGPSCGQSNGCGGACPASDDNCGYTTTGYTNACGRYCPATCQWTDCHGECNGPAQNDSCGVCGGDGRSCCNNSCSGPFYCDGSTGNCICTGSCSGYMCGQGDGCGGSCPSYDIDACGVCGGGAQSCGGGGTGCGWYDCDGSCDGDEWGCMF